MYDRESFGDVNDKPSVGPGDYLFEITEAYPYVWGSGTEGIRMELAVKVAPDRKVKVYESLFFTPKAGWKIKAFMDAIGMDFDNPPDDPAELAGSYGYAGFHKGERGYLEVDRYHSRQECMDAIERDRAAERKPKVSKVAGAVRKDDVPF